MPTTTKPRKLTPTMLEALGEFWNARSTQGVPGTGTILDWCLGRPGTHVALIDRGMVTTSWTERDGRRRVQITPAGCEAVGHSMDEIVAQAWDAAVADYSARCVSPTPEGGYNLMTELPIEVGAVVQVRSSGYRGVVTRVEDDGVYIANDGVVGRVVLPISITRVIELAPANAVRLCGGVDGHQAHTWQDIYKGGIFECPGRDLRLSLDDAWIDAVSLATAGKLPPLNLDVRLPLDEAYDAATEEYKDRIAPFGPFNLMTELPVAVGAVVQLTPSGHRYAVTHASPYAVSLIRGRFSWFGSPCSVERVIELAPTSPLAKCEHGYATEGRIEDCPAGCATPAAKPVAGRIESLLRSGVTEIPSTFKGADPVRTYADGSQSFGPYPPADPTAHPSDADVYRAIADIIDLGAPTPANTTVDKRRVSLQLGAHGDDDSMAGVDAWAAHLGLSAAFEGQVRESATGRWRTYQAGGEWHGRRVEVWTAVYVASPTSSITPPAARRSDTRLQADLRAGRADRTALPIVAPTHPEGTPEYAAYKTELSDELAKFAAGKDPYPYPTT